MRESTKKSWITTGFAALLTLPVMPVMWLVTGHHWPARSIVFVLTLNACGLALLFFERQRHFERQ